MRHVRALRFAVNSIAALHGAVTGGKEHPESDARRCGCNYTDAIYTLESLIGRYRAKDRKRQAASRERKELL